MRNDLPPRYALAAMAVCLVLLAPRPTAASNHDAAFKLEQRPTAWSDPQIRALDKLFA
jgi:hypothetical protein